jgi:hypothetical protein
VAIRNYCGRCGHEVGPDAKYCSNCGGPIYQATRAPTPESDAKAGSEAGAPSPSQPAPERTPSSAPSPINTEGFFPRLAWPIGVLGTGLLLFVLGLLIGFSPEESFWIVAILGTLLWLVFRPYRRSVRTAPGHTRSIPQRAKIAVAARDGAKCRRCGSTYDLQYDHIIPYSRGGSSTDVNNIQLLCGRCNRLKSNRYIG